MHADMQVDLEEHVDDAVAAVVVVEENEEAPVDQPCPLLQLLQRRCETPACVCCMRGACSAMAWHGGRGGAGACKRVCKHACVCASVRACTHMRARTCAHADAHTCVCTLARTCVRMCVRVCMRAHTRLWLSV